MQDLLVDTNWLLRCEREARKKQTGPAVRLMDSGRCWMSVIVACELKAKGRNLWRERIIGTLKKLPALDYRDANRAGSLRLARAKQGKPLATADAFIAASAMRYGLQLLTADKDFSGIPGLDWSSYPG